MYSIVERRFSDIEVDQSFNFSVLSALSHRIIVSTTQTSPNQMYLSLMMKLFTNFSLFFSGITAIRHYTLAYIDDVVS